jgi:hypothetical protein
VSTFLYDTAVSVLGNYILVPAIVFSIVGAAWLIGRVAERIGLWWR